MQVRYRLDSLQKRIQVGVGSITMQDTGWIHYNIGYRLDTKQYRIKVGNITQIKGWIHYNEEYRLEFREP